MGFELRSGSTVWAPASAPSLTSPGITRDTGIFAETVQDPTIQWANRVSPGGRRYEYTFESLTLVEIGQLEAFEDAVNGGAFQFREGAPGDPCAEITAYRDVTFADDGYVPQRHRTGFMRFSRSLILQDATVEGS